MTRKWKDTLNPFFMAPFLVWMLAGGVILSIIAKGVVFRVVNEHNTTLLDILMAGFTRFGEVSVIIPALLVPALFPRFRHAAYFIYAAACNLLPFFAEQLLKSFFDRPRPLSFYGEAAWLHKLPEWPELYHRSFPSGHSTGAFSLFCFFSLLLPGKWRWIGLVFFMLAFAAGYSRVYLTAHFAEDVYFGSFVGVSVTSLVFLFLQRHLRLERGNNLTEKH